MFIFGVKINASIIFTTLNESRLINEIFLDLYSNQWMSMNVLNEQYKASVTKSASKVKRKKSQTVTHIFWTLITSASIVIWTGVGFIYIAKIHILQSNFLRKIKNIYIIYLLKKTFNFTIFIKFRNQICEVIDEKISNF